MLNHWDHRTLLKTIDKRKICGENGEERLNKLSTDRYNWWNRTDSTARSDRTVCFVPIKFGFGGGKPNMNETKWNGAHNDHNQTEHSQQLYFIFHMECVSECERCGVCTGLFAICW